MESDGLPHLCGGENREKKKKGEGLKAPLHDFKRS
jgi:hypothetical protein